MKRKIFDFEHRSVKKITRQGASRRSKGGKKYRGQGGPRKKMQASQEIRLKT